MSESNVDPSSGDAVDRELAEAREEIKLLKFRLHSVELAFYEHELRYAKAKRQLKSPLYRVYAGTYRLLLKPFRPLAVRGYYFAKRLKRVVDRKLRR